MVSSGALSLSYSLPTSGQMCSLFGVTSLLNLLCWELAGRAGCQLDGASFTTTAGGMVSHSSFSSPGVTGCFPSPCQPLCCANISPALLLLAVMRVGRTHCSPQGQVSSHTNLPRKWSAGIESQSTLLLLHGLSRAWD